MDLNAGPDPRPLLRALLAVRKLVRALGREVRVVAGAEGAKPPAWLAELLSLARDAYGLADLRLCDAAPHQLDAFEQVVSETLALERWTAAAPEREPGTLHAAIAEVAQEAPELAFHGETLRAADGAHLAAYAAGAPSAPAIALVLPLGMPVELSAMWLRRLAHRQRVVAWETRGLFADEDRIEAIGTGLDAQARDLFAVLDHDGIERCHVAGLCSGAVVALRAAALAPQRVASLSLWNGDYYGLGADCPRTAYQKGFAALTALVARDRERAAQVQRRFLEPAAIAGADRRWAHLTLYPYANAELLHRFGRLNVPVIDAALGAWIGEVVAPTLVVTSETDERAHPEGSRRVARSLPHGRLHAEPEGDHLSVLTVQSHLVDRAARFAQEHARS